MGGWRLLAVVLSAGLGTGCLVQIDHVADPRRAFDRARAEALRDAAAGPGRPRQLNVLAYDAGDRKLVRVSLPWWLVRKVRGRIDRDGDRWSEGEARGRVADQLRHLRWEVLDTAGRGILVEAEEGGGEQVLIWLR